MRHLTLDETPFQVKGSPTLSRKTFLLRSQSAPRLDSNRRILRTAGPEPCSEEGPGHGEVESAALRSKAGTDDIEISDVTDQETCVDRFVVSYKLVNFRPITVEEATVSSNLPSLGLKMRRKYLHWPMHCLQTSPHLPAQGGCTLRAQKPNLHRVKLLRVRCTNSSATTVV